MEKEVIKDVIKEIPIILFIGIFSIPIVIGRWAIRVMEKYVDWAWKQKNKDGR